MDSLWDHDRVVRPGCCFASMVEGEAVFGAPRWEQEDPSSRQSRKRAS
jgi:hypothetical protein